MIAPPPEFFGLRTLVSDRFTLRSANRCLFQRSVEWGPLDGLLTSIVPATGRINTDGALPDQVRILVPVMTTPKVAPAALAVTGPGGAAARVIPYPTSVAIQGNVVTLLAATLGTAPGGPARRMVDAIAQFRPGRLTGNLPHLVPSNGAKLGADAIQEYLHESADLDVPIGVVRSWLAIVERTEALLLDALVEPFDALSSADNLLLALGELWRDRAVPPVLDAPAIEAYLRAFAAWVDRLAEVGPAAVPVVATVAEYGRRMEVLVSVTIGSYEPFAVQMQEEFRANLFRQSPVRATSRLPAVLSWSPVALVDINPDSPGPYLARIGSEDSSIELVRPAIVDMVGQRVRRAFVEDVHRHREMYGFYSSDPRRPTPARLVVGLRLSADVSGGYVALLALLVASVTVCALPVRLSAEALTVMALPPSFAATLLLTRESTTLAAWIVRPLRLVIFFLLVALMALLLARAAGWLGIHDPPP